MKMSTESLQTINHNTIHPYRVRQGLIGLDFDETSQNLLRYLAMFSSKVPIEAVHFLHVVPKHNLFNVFEEEESDLLSQSVGIDKELINKLKLQVKTNFPVQEKMKIKVEVREGDPLEELLETADKIKSDMVIIGQNAERNHHGILGKNFARQIWNNALVVPSKVRMSLKNILVPVDFSPNSAEALRAAVAINKNLETPASISVLHNYQLPANFSAYRFNQEKVMEMLKEDRKNALDNFIQEHVPAEDSKSLKPILLGNNHFSVGQYIHAFAEKRKFDLIVMGAKGHSKVALLLLGSVTEKVISLTKHVPVLIIR